MLPYLGNPNWVRGQAVSPVSVRMSCRGVIFWTGLVSDEWAQAKLTTICLTCVSRIPCATSAQALLFSLGLMLRAAGEDVTLSKGFVVNEVVTSATYGDLMEIEGRLTIP